MTFVAGCYTATFKTLRIGHTAEGIRLGQQLFKRLITSDRLGQSPINAINQGMEMLSNFRCLEFDAAAMQSLIWPFGSAFNCGLVGAVDWTPGGSTNAAGSLVLTRLNSSLGGPATITLPQSVLQENFPVELLYGPDLREVPIRLRHYPLYDDSSPSTMGSFGSST